ncbi:MAG: AMP-binding protein, partial [Pseudomonadota bacterium]
MAFVPSFPINSIADVRRLEETPLDEAITISSTYELFVASARAFGDKTALRFLTDADPDSPTIAWSYDQLLKRIHQTANLLHRLGIEATDTVSILLPGCLEYHLALWGGEAAGIVNPLNPLLSEDKLAELMVTAKTKVLIAYGAEGDSDYWQKALNLRSRVSTLHTLLRVEPHDESPDAEGPLPDDCLNFSAHCRQQPNDKLTSGREIKSADTAAYFHTG